MPAGARVVDLAGAPAVDGHCHPLLADPWDVAASTFVELFTEGRPGTMGGHVEHTGYYRRAVAALARRLGVDPSVDAVLAARRRGGPGKAAAALEASGVAALLVDTGYPPDAMPLDEMRRRLPCAIHEVVRVEACAEARLRAALPY
ncbi:MAG TPA: hypothetical protein VNN07_17730, partial [Candidatus Tectomicrobia bacterium]|nr:hypothetical protein [Candidatus Tectomicrobia bacterium]